MTALACERDTLQCRAWRRRPVFGILVVVGLLIVGGCATRGAVTVSGKTVYGNLAVEEVRVEAREAGGGPAVAWTTSGYHGSFVLRLQPGIYDLVAAGTLPDRGGDILKLAGTLNQLTVRAGSSRIDRVVLRLAPSAAESTP